MGFHFKAIGKLLNKRVEFAVFLQGGSGIHHLAMACMKLRFFFGLSSTREHQVFNSSSFIRWTPWSLVVAIWKSVVGAHCIIVFQMPNPLDHGSAMTNITTINNISFVFNKNLAVLKFKLRFGLASVSGGHH